MSATYYTALGISETATAAEIKEAYRKLSEVNHPDKGGDVERFKLITAAFNAVKNIAAKRRGPFGNRSDLAWQRAWEALPKPQKAPKAKAEPKAPRTFDGNAVTEHRCATCGEVKKVNAFPTVTGKGATGTGKRGVECRKCRDTRAKAAKASKAAA